MKRKLVTALCGTLALAMALPAFAKDHKINGFFRARFMIEGGRSGGISPNVAKDFDPQKNVDQRFRAKWTMGLNEYVSVTYYGEVDFVYGDVSYGTHRNDGGALGGDTVNLETKNLYLNVKIPDTPVSTRIGLQGFGDHWDFVFVAADMAGVSVRAKLDSVSLTGVWAKWFEGGANGDTDENDVDFWGIQVGFKPMGDLKLGVDGYYLNVNGDYGGMPASNSDLYYLGVHAAYKLPMVNLQGWAFYNFGSMNAEGKSDADVAAFAASLKGTASVAGAKVGLRLFYFSGDDDNGDGDVNSAFLMTGRAENFPFFMDGLMLLTPDKTWTTLGHEGYGFVEAQNQGYGLWGAILSTAYTPPTMKKMYINLSLGYMSAVEDDRTPGDGSSDREGTTIGTEIAARVGYKVADLVDVSLNGSYLSLGDFFDKQAGGDDPDNPYTLYAMVNVPF